MAGQGERFLHRALQSIESQHFSDHETIVSDDSAGDEIESLCRHFSKVRYVRHSARRGNSSANLNHALQHAKGAHVKILFQDDFLAVPWALGAMLDGMRDKAWLVHAYWHTDFAGYARLAPTRPALPDDPESLLRGNPLGAPSAVMFRKNDLTFDENLIWFMDCEFYFRLWRRFGPPALLPAPLAVQTLWPGQLTHRITDAVKQAEADYLTQKYAPPPVLLSPGGPCQPPSPTHAQAPADPEIPAG